MRVAVAVLRREHRYGSGVMRAVVVVLVVLCCCGSGSRAQFMRIHGKRSGGVGGEQPSMLLGMLLPVEAGDGNVLPELERLMASLARDSLRGGERHRPGRNAPHFPGAGVSLFNSLIPLQDSMDYRHYQHAAAPQDYNAGVKKLNELG